MPHEPNSTVSTQTPHVLVTGATGFVGQAILERLLSQTHARVSVLIRGRGTQNAQIRLQELLDKPVFGVWRSRLGEQAAAAAIAERVHLLDGDLRDVPALPGDLDAVVHSASSVSFDDPVDKAFTTNVGGPQALYRALAQAGNNPHVVHISTSYVSTGRVDVAAEARLNHEVDWRAELSGALELRRRLARQHGPQSAALTKSLREAGRERARELGWTDAYTMSKALGERVAEELWAKSGQQLTILRPTIIESALHYPFPGWIDGFKVADPLIAAYAQGRLVGFPGHPDNILDIIPVDFVVSAVLAALRTPPAPGSAEYLQVSSSTSNPLTLEDLRHWVQEYFALHPWIDRHGNEIHPDHWAFSDPAALSRWVRRRRAALSGSATLLNLLPTGWLSGSRQAVRRGQRSLETMSAFVNLYEPYTCASTTYEDVRTRALMAEHTSSDDRLPSLDITSIDWQRYLTTAHLPAVAAIMSGRTPTARGTSGSSRSRRAQRNGERSFHVVRQRETRSPLAESTNGRPRALGA